MLDPARLDPVSAETVRRCFLLLAVIATISVFAASEPARVFAALSEMNAFLAAAFAAARRTPIVTQALTRWDEALMFAACALGARALA
jgi:hypothetical protein